MKIFSMIAAVLLLFSMAAAQPYEAATVPDSCQELAVPSVPEYPKMHTKLDEENEMISVWLDRAVDYLAVNIYGQGPVQLRLDSFNGAVYSTRRLKTQPGITASVLSYSGTEYTKTSFKETDPDKIRLQLFKAGALPLDKGKTMYDYVIAETDTKHWGVYRHSTYGEHAYTVIDGDVTVFYDRSGKPMTVFKNMNQDLFDSNMPFGKTSVTWMKNGNTGAWYAAVVSASYTESRVTSISAYYLPDKFNTLYRITATYQINSTVYTVQYDKDFRFEVAFASDSYGSYRNAVSASKADTDWYNTTTGDWFPVRDFHLVPLSQLTFVRLR